MSTILDKYSNHNNSRDRLASSPEATNDEMNSSIFKSAISIEADDKISEDDGDDEIGGGDEEIIVGEVVIDQEQVSLSINSKENSISPRIIQISSNSCVNKEFLNNVDAFIVYKVVRPELFSLCEYEEVSKNSEQREAYYSTKYVCVSGDSKLGTHCGRLHTFPWEPGNSPLVPKVLNYWCLEVSVKKYICCAQRNTYVVVNCEYSCPRITCTQSAVNDKGGVSFSKSFDPGITRISFSWKPGYLPRVVLCSLVLFASRVYMVDLLDTKSKRDGVSYENGITNKYGVVSSICGKVCEQSSQDTWGFVPVMGTVKLNIANVSRQSSGIICSTIGESAEDLQHQQQIQEQSECCNVDSIASFSPICDHNPAVMGINLHNVFVKMFLLLQCDSDLNK